jgi:FlaG/FlaF family flagellin (archaellin)
MKSFRRSIKAVSPVIATIIIVAIAITMSIAVAYWVLGLGSSFTKYEKVEFTSGYADLNSTGTTFTTILNFKNTGSATAMVDNATIFYNGKPAVGYGTSAPSALLNMSFTSTTLNLLPGEIGNATITMTRGGTWVSGMTVEIMIQTSAGKQYPKVITLP